MLHNWRQEVLFGEGYLVVTADSIKAFDLTLASRTESCSATSSLLLWSLRIFCSFLNQSIDSAKRVLTVSERVSTFHLERLSCGYRLSKLPCDQKVMPLRSYDPSLE